MTWRAPESDEPSHKDTEEARRTREVSSFFIYITGRILSSYTDNLFHVGGNNCRRVLFTHRVPELELKLHTKQCTDRATFESYKYCISSQPANIPPKETTAPELVYNNSPPKEPFDKTRSVRSKKQPILPPPGLRDDDDDECWDDMNIPAYNPQTYCATAKVIRKATLKKPSEKKAFYESERLRLQDLKLND